MNKNNDKNVEIIRYDDNNIEIRKDGIYRINLTREESKEIFDGEFLFIGWQRGRYPCEDVFIVMRNDKFYMGTFDELMKELRPYRNRMLDNFKVIFNHYKRENDEKENDEKENDEILYHNKLFIQYCLKGESIKIRDFINQFVHNSQDLKDILNNALDLIIKSKSIPKEVKYDLISLIKKYKDQLNLGSNFYDISKWLCIDIHKVVCNYKEEYEK